KLIQPPSQTDPLPLVPRCRHAHYWPPGRRRASAAWPRSIEVRKLSDTLGALLIVAVVCALATGFFVAFAAPAVPRTVWGWAMALVLGLPLLLFVDVVFDYFLGVGV